MNRAERRRNQRESQIGKTVIGWIKHSSPKELKQGNGWFGELDTVYSNGHYCVMTRVVETTIGKVIHACMRNEEGTDICWSEKQWIKNELFGPEHQAVEIFPKESLLVDEVNMYHLWILPKDTVIPFGLVPQTN